MNKYMLCQDCLKIEDAALMVADGLDQCSCGGDFCDCYHCNQVAQRLLEGERRSSKLYLQKKGVIEWNAQSGFVKLMPSGRALVRRLNQAGRVLHRKVRNIKLHAGVQEFCTVIPF